jgi:hypothetical protein
MVIWNKSIRARMVIWDELTRARTATWNERFTLAPCPACRFASLRSASADRAYRQFGKSLNFSGRCRRLPLNFQIHPPILVTYNWIVMNKQITSLLIKICILIGAFFLGLAAHTHAQTPAGSTNPADTTHHRYGMHRNFGMRRDSLHRNADHSPSMAAITDTAVIANLSTIPPSNANR